MLLSTFMTVTHSKRQIVGAANVGSSVSAFKVNKDIFAHFLWFGVAEKLLFRFVL